MSKVEFLLEYVGNWGNVLLQVFIASQIAKTLEAEMLLTTNDPRVARTLEEMDIDFVQVEKDSSDRFVVRKFYSIKDVANDFIASGKNSIEIITCNIPFSDWPTRENARALIPDSNEERELFGHDEIVINIRGGNILKGIHIDYVVLPPAFYRYIINITNLKPVFFGQLEPGIYSDLLRKEFPDARFVMSSSPKADFRSLLGAKNIVVAVSTFSILSAWMSDCREIHYPLCGGLNPFQRSEARHIPVDDERYNFYMFPIMYMEREELFTSRFEEFGSPWLPIERGELARRLRNWPKFPISLDKALQVFDPKFYAEFYADVIPKIQNTDMSVTDHYVKRGFPKHRLGCQFDRQAYAIAYRDAAASVGYGEYRRLYDHYVMVGHDLGYNPVPALA